MVRSHWVCVVRCRSARFDHDLDAGVVLVSKRAIHGRRLFKADTMRDDDRRIDLAAFDALEQQRHVLVHVRLTHLERQPLREGSPQRELVEPSAVDAGNRDRPTLAARANRLAKGMRAIGRQEHRGLRAVVPGIERRTVRFESDGVDARIRPLTSCQLPQRLENVDV